MWQYTDIDFTSHLVIWW